MSTEPPDRMEIKGRASGGDRLVWTEECLSDFQQEVDVLSNVGDRPG